MNNFEKKMINLSQFITIYNFYFQIIYTLNLKKNLNSYKNYPK